MRARISESNIFPKFDLFEEYKKIEYLISQKGPLWDNIINLANISHRNLLWKHM